VNERRRLGDVKISRSGRTAPVGEVTLTSNGRDVKVFEGSAMLSLADDSGPEVARGGGAIKEFAGCGDLVPFS
jgi:hypothetical protein